jgi:energy-coupling factor transporter transmembrane protein EcfT
MSSKPSGSLFSRIKDELETYIEARANLFQLETTEKIARLIGLMAVVMLAASLLILFILCISLMAGFFFARLFESNFYGFGLVAGFYLILFLILITAGKEKLATFISNKFIKALFNKTADYED